jgi:protein-tyrosine phosphatase
MDGWRPAGVDVVVSLLENEEAAQLELLDERAAVEGSHLRFISFPIPDREASMRQAMALMAAIAGALELGKNVAVHCRQGIGRSGAIAAGGLTTSGAGPESAFDLISARGARVPETREQRLRVERLSSGFSVIVR